MISKKQLPPAAPVSREVSLHLWPAGEEKRPMDWKTAQSFLLRRRNPFLITFGVVLAQLLMALMLLAPLYRATSTLQVNTGAQSSNESDLPVVAELTGSGQTRTLTTQLEILNNDGVRGRALALLSPADRAQVNTKSAVVKAIPDTDLISITSSSRDAHAAAAFSNALASAYLGLSRDKNGQQYAAARRYVGQQLQDARVRLNGARSAIARYKQANGTVDLPAQSQSQIAELSRVQTDWNTARADKEAALVQLKNLRASLPNLPENVVASSVIAKSPAVTAKQASLTALETQLITARQEFNPDAPEVQALQSQIAGLRRELQNAAQTEVQSLQSTLNPQRQATEAQITTLQGQVWSLEARGVALKAQTKRLQVELERLPQREQTLGQLTTDLTGLQQSYDTLNQKYQSLRASEAGRVASGALLFAAQAPAQADSRFSPLNLLAALALASLVALAVASVIDRFDRRVHSSRDLTESAALPVLAQIPLISGSSSRSLLALQAPVSPLLENFRGLRTRLALTPLDEDGHYLHSLAVTSSLPNEGKSLLALNLAVAAARGGERVVLVDCDLRRPSQHRLCGLSNDIGFVSVADGQVTLEAALQSTSVPGLRVLTSGPLSSNPFGVLNGRSGREILRRLTEIADFVVIDTPPVLILADARITATFADSTLLVVSTEEPGRDEVALAGDLLAQSGARVAGIVLNKVAPGPDFLDYYSRFPYYAMAINEKSGESTRNGNGNAQGATRSRVRDVGHDEGRHNEGPQEDGTTMVSYRPPRSDGDN